MSRVIKSNIQQNNSAHCPKILIKPVAIMAPMIKKKIIIKIKHLKQKKLQNLIFLTKTLIFLIPHLAKMKKEIFILFTQKIFIN